MRWIAVLVASCLVALGAVRGPRLPDRDGDGDGDASSMKDASGLVAKLAPRRTSVVAPDKRTQRPNAYLPSSPPKLGTPRRHARVAIATLRPSVPRTFLVSRLSRGPPASRSSVSVHPS